MTGTYPNIQTFVLRFQYNVWEHFFHHMGTRDQPKVSDLMKSTFYILDWGLSQDKIKIQKVADLIKIDIRS